jgi:hypothetical protein
LDRSGNRIFRIVGKYFPGNHSLFLLVEMCLN